MSDFDSAHATVCALIADYTAHRDTYVSPAYSEAQARLSFIDKFWTALGWDVSHVTQKNPYEQEVLVEKTVGVGGQQKKADYAFSLAPNCRMPLFFVEAKKPSAQLDKPDHCFQLIRYAWSTKCPLSVLHDFEELLVLDCRWRPHIETAHTRIWKRFHYTDFTDPEQFRFLYHLFSREAVANASIFKRAAELPRPRAKANQRSLFKPDQSNIDETFLNDLEKWRADLARAFKRENHDLDSETLTEITQRTLDRLVFLRFLEDKGIEQRTTVGALGAASGDPWADFLAACRRLDRVYNGAIFRLHDVLDGDGLAAPAGAFAGICEDIGAPNSSYDFNGIPIHILGSIYERFLGSVIVATGKQARVEQKPEVRKAGGVYYTPEYIVRYIVAQTVGRQLEGKTPAQIEPLSFADIACGSGSFLLGVFDCLLRYHTIWYNKHPDQARLHSDAVYTRKGKITRAEKAGDCRRDEDTGVLRLTLEKKRQLLLNNVFGTDLDPQAIEVSQLSLYLKLLEDETAGSTHQYQLDFDKDALLPSLDKNIICGNALIGSDIAGLFDLEPEEEEKLRPLDYPHAFPQVFKRGGFDAVVGNPPYVQLSMKDFRDDRVNAYLKSTYRFSGGRANTFAFFIEQARHLTRPHGRVSYIIPNTILTQEGYEELRIRLLAATSIEAVIQSKGTIFAAAVVETVVLVLGNRPKADTPVSFGLIAEDGTIEPQGTLIQAALSENYKAAFAIPSEMGTVLVRKRMEATKLRMGAFLNFNQAIALKHDRAACLASAPLSSKHHMVLDGRHIGRYVTGDSPNYFKFDLAKIHSCKREDIFLLPEKIFMRRVGDRIIATLDDSQRYALNTLVVVSPQPTCEWGISFILGVLNSRLVNFYYVSFLKSTKKVFSEIQARQVEQIPLPVCSLAKPADRARHDKMVSLVRQMLKAKQQQAGAMQQTKQDFWARKCESLDQQIDAVVYELYGLTEEEIALVEGHGAPAGKEGGDE